MQDRESGGAGAVKLRMVSPEDAEQLLGIYAPYVSDTAVSFEYEVPSLEEFRSRVEHVLERYPWLCAEQDGKLLGYASTKAFIPRAAYDWTAETTVYIRRDCCRAGLGSRLYRALEEISRAQNLTRLYACIGVPETEDEYLTFSSRDFHRHMGYRTAGTFRRCGWKFGRCYDMVWMEKVLAEPDRDPAPVLPCPGLQPGLVERICASC